MDQSTIHGIFTLALFIAFILLVRNVMRKKHNKQFDEAARIPLDDDQE